MSMSLKSKLRGTVAALCVFASSLSFATVEFPLFDITSLSGDLGVVSDGSDIEFGGSAFGILNGSTDFIDIDDLQFSLQAGASTSSSAFQTEYGSGSLLITDGSTTFLAADFASLNVGIGSLSGDVGILTADLFNMSGISAVQDTGRLEGSFNTGGISAFGGNAFDADFIAKVGPITAIPLPAALIFFGSALSGLAGLRLIRKV